MNMISGNTNPTVYQVDDIDEILDCILEPTCVEQPISLNVLDVTNVVTEPADMGYDRKRNRLLIPNMKLEGGDETNNFASFKIVGCR